MSIKSKPSMRVRLTQHPVGQGGMMSGRLIFRGLPSKTSSGFSKFHWVYDCGSNQTKNLESELEKIACLGEVDCLFISHLDTDYINGIQSLLSKVSVREVVLPYLDAVDKLIVVANESTRGVVSGTLVAFLSDIEGWFSARGVKSIVYISPDSGDEGDNSLSPLIDDGDSPNKRNISSELVEENFHKPIWKNGQNATLKPIEHPSGVIVQQLDVGAILIGRAQSKVDWIWAPYAHRPSKELMEPFISHLNERLPGWDSPGYLLKVVADRKLLKELKESYKLIWSDHNLVSMALYSGPNSISYPYVYRDYAWLLTGDMHLDVKIRRRKFISYFRNLLYNVHVFGLPHHGSKHNFHPFLLDAVPNAEYCVAAFGENDYGHPSDEVEFEVIRSGKDFCSVNTDVKSALIMRLHIWDDDFDKRRQIL